MFDSLFKILKTLQYFDSMSEKNTLINRFIKKCDRKHVSDKPVPSISELERELKKVRYRQKYFQVLYSTILTLVTVASVSVLVAILFLPVLQIYGASMSPTLSEGNIVVSVKGAEFQQGDIISFYYNNNILVKRAIAFAGDWVDIDEDGNTYINGELLDEPYLTERALGDCNIEFPYQVPDGDIFVMGDHRATSVDSRNTSVGCVSKDQIVGKIVFRLWPLNEFGAI